VVLPHMVALRRRIGQLRTWIILLFPWKISICMPNKLLLKIEWSTCSNRVYQLDWCLHYRLTLIYWSLVWCSDVSDGAYIQIYALTSCSQTEFYWISTWFIRRLCKFEWDTVKRKQVSQSLVPNHFIVMLLKYLHM
jgi:hypothetical protein